MNIEKILKVAVQGGASDILLKVGSVPRFRHSGDLIGLHGGEKVSQELMNQWLDILVPKYQKKLLDDLQDLDFSYQSANGYRFRVNVFRQQQKFGIVLRVINNHIKTLEELQLPQVLHRLAEERRGLLLVTGATGSGKSTTLAAMIEKINLNRAAHVITIEDPIEYTYTEKKSTINQREIGLDTTSFAAALRSALRQNPDVILVGELRDAETVHTAIHAAETGHLVFSTLHTQDARESLTRILSFFPPHQHDLIKLSLSQTLKGVISQRLIPRSDRKGMVPAMEIMIATDLVREIILKGKNWELPEVIRKNTNKTGMQSFDQSLYQLYQKGVISREIAIAAASNSNDFELLLSGIAS